MNTLERLECVGKLFTLFLSLSIAIGVFIISYYCGTINFFPSNIEIGDGLLFILISLTFGGRLIITITLMSIIGLSLYPFFYKLIQLTRVNTTHLTAPSPLKDLIPAHLVLLLVVIGTAFGFYHLDTIKDEDVLRALCFFVSAWANGIVINNIPKNSSLNWLLRISIIFVTLFITPFFVVPEFTKMMTTSSLKDIGIIQGNRTLIFNEEEKNNIIKSSEASKCDLDITTLTKNSMLKDVDVLFHGYGDNSKIQVKDTKKICFKINIPSNSFTIAEIPSQ